MVLTNGVSGGIPIRNTGQRERVALVPTDDQPRSGQHAQAEMQPGTARPERAGDRAEDVYTRLRHAILVMDLMPGEALSERALEGLLGSSRTPIREALLRLEVEGLVTRQGRSLRVTALELSAVLEVFEYREFIEAAVAQLASQRATPEGIARIQAVLDQSRTRDDTASWFAIGTDFHVMLAGLSGNGFLVRAMTDILTRIERARWIMCSLPSARSEAYDEHSQILRLVAEGRADEAAAALVAHGRGLRDILSEALSQQRLGLRGRGAGIGPKG